MDPNRVLRRQAAASVRAHNLISRIGTVWPNVPTILDRWAGFIGNELTLPGFEETLLQQSLRAGRQAVRKHNLRILDDRVGAVAFLAGTICSAETVRYLNVGTDFGIFWVAADGAFHEWRTENPGELMVTWRDEPSGQPIEDILVTASDRRVLGSSYEEVMERLRNGGAQRFPNLAIEHEADGKGKTTLNG